MASGPITSWQIDGETVESVRDFIFGGSKITADGDCSHEIERRLLLGRKVMTNLDSILKSSDITLPTRVRLVKAMVFPVVMYGCESWTIKKAECRRIDDFELWCWRRFVRVPWTARRSIQSILKEIRPGCSLEGVILKLKLQYLGTWCEELTHLKRPWCWEWLRAGGEGDDRGSGGWMASPTQWTWVWVGLRSWYWTGRPDVLWFMGSQRVRHDWATELNWTEQSMKGLLSSHLCQHVLLLKLFCVLHFMLTNPTFKKKKIHFIVSIQLITSSYVYWLFRLPCLSVPDLYLHTCEYLTSERRRQKLGEVFINVENFCCSFIYTASLCWGPGIVLSYRFSAEVVRKAWWLSLYLVLQFQKTMNWWHDRREFLKAYE